MLTASSSGGGHLAAAALGRTAGGALERRTSFRPRTGDNRHYYPRVSVGLIPASCCSLFGGRVHYG